MKHLRDWKNEEGAASFWILLLAIIVIAAIVAMKLLPRPQAPKPEPIVVRMKIPSIPPPTITTRTDEQKESLPVAAVSPPLDQESASSPGPAMHTELAADSPDNAGLSARLEAPSEQPADEAEATPTAATNDQNPPSPPATAPENTSADATAAGRFLVDKAQEENTTTDDTTPTLAAGKQEQKMSSDPIPISAENGNEADKDTAIQSESPTSENNDAPPTNGNEKQKPFTIQVGVYHSKRNAENMASGLKALGYSTVIHESQDKHLRPLYKVYVGRFESMKKAVQIADAFKKKEKKPAIVVRSVSQ